MADYDAVLDDSGINSLACAAFLSRAGWRVAVLEREAQLGGAIRTAEPTEPGFHHDVFSAWHPLWVGGPAHAELAGDLAERGLEYLNTGIRTERSTPTGRARSSRPTPRRTRPSSTATLPVTGPPGATRSVRSRHRRSSCSGPRHGAVVGRGAESRGDGVPASRSPRPRGIRRRGRSEQP